MFSEELDKASAGPFLIERTRSATHQTMIERGMPVLGTYPDIVTGQDAVYSMSDQLKSIAADHHYTDASELLDEPNPQFEAVEYGQPKPSLKRRQTIPEVHIDSSELEGLAYNMPTSPTSHSSVAESVDQDIEIARSIEIENEQERDNQMDDRV